MHARRYMTDFPEKFRIIIFTWRSAGLNRIFVTVLGALFEVMLQYSWICTPIGNSIIL
jgi:hypothetical protein